MANILVVDDSVVYRQIIVDILQSGGHNVVGEAVNGVEGVSLYKKLRPEIITLDLTMPELDGLGVLKIIKDDDPNAQVIIVSASAQSKMIAKAIRLGATDFLPKPFESKKVLEAIERIIAANELEDDDAEIDLSDLNLDV